MGLHSYKCIICEGQLIRKEKKTQWQPNINFKNVFFSTSDSLFFVSLRFYCLIDCTHASTSGFSSNLRLLSCSVLPYFIFVVLIYIILFCLVLFFAFLVSGIDVKKIFFFIYWVLCLAPHLGLGLNSISRAIRCLSNIQEFKFSFKNLTKISIFLFSSQN